jgi:hypothetical protein
MIWGSHPIRGKRFFFPPNHPDWLGDPHSLPFNRYCGLLPLRVTGAVLSLPLYVFTACVGKPLHFTFYRE